MFTDEFTRAAREAAEAEHAAFLLRAIERREDIKAEREEQERLHAEAMARFDKKRKIWVVTAEDSSGDGVYVVRICATKEIAEQYIERFHDLHEHYLEPAEWDVDTECPERRTLWKIHLDNDGTVTAEHSLPCDYARHWAMTFHDGSAMVESTQGREAALKLAREQLGEMKAGNA